MSFTVEITFSGLGLVILRSGESRSPQPRSVSFHMVIGGGDHACHMRHVPRIWFRTEDLLAPAGQPFRFLSTAPDGISVISEDLSGKTLTFSAEGGSPTSFDVKWLTDATATAPGTGEEDALDWIPDLGDHVGLTSISEPAAQLAPPYLTRIELPGGEIRSRQILRAPDPTNPAGAPGRFRFGQGLPRVIAEQVVWRRRGVNRLELAGLVDGERLVFDGSFRALQTPGGGEPVVSLALTNLPEQAVSGRFARIEHLTMLASLAVATLQVAGEVPRNPVPVIEQGGPVTSGSLACPPARLEIVGGGS
jgi:hypothetical protein